MDSNQHVYGYLRQHTRLPKMKLHSYVEIEAAVDKAKGLSDRVGMRREKEMVFQQRLGQAFGFKAREFRTATIVWE